MSQISEFDAEEPEFKTLTPEEAQKVLRRIRPTSPWRVVSMQIVVGVLFAFVAWISTSKNNVGWSVLYGAIAVALPASLLAFKIRSNAKTSSYAALIRFFVWEFVKIILTVALFAAAPKIVPALSWGGLLVGLILALNMYWVAFLMPSRLLKPD